MRHVDTTAEDILRWHTMPANAVAGIMDYFYQPNPQIEFNELRDALSKGQLASKYWLREQMFDAVYSEIDFGEPMPKFKIAVIGGWIGTLPWIIESGYGSNVGKYLLIDKDQRCQAFAEHLNRDMVNSGKFEYVPFDAFHPISVQTIAEADVVINTSCEHFKDYSWLDLVTPGSWVVAQSNNYTGPVDHVNICTSADNLNEKLGLSEVMSVGTMVFPNVYDRYMVIGKK